MSSEGPSWPFTQVHLKFSCLLTIGNTYLCLAVLDGVLCVIFLHGRNSPQSSPTSTPRLLKSLSFELHPDDIVEKPMSPMQYARSGLGTAELNGKLIAAGTGSRDKRMGGGDGQWWLVLNSIRSSSESAFVDVGAVKSLTFCFQADTTERSVCAQWNAMTHRRTPGPSLHRWEHRELGSRWQF